MRAPTHGEFAGIVASVIVITLIVLLFVFAISDRRDTAYKMKHNALEQMYQSASERCDSLTQVIAALNKEDLDSGYVNADFEIDFGAINAFSIERAPQDKREVTVIGYRDKDDEVKQWYFQCSRETHNRLAEQFKREILER